MHILSKMQEAMGEAKTEVSNFAPKLFTMKINPEKIRDVIGKGGAVIRALTEETGTQINIDEDGTITIASTDSAKADEAKRRIEQIIDALMGEYKERFMLHYNMPPFATGETGRVGSPKRREIGHGRLAKRALIAVLPAKDEFPYTMRVVSEIT